jgi:hypothetical protein
VGELRGSDLPIVREQLGRDPTTPFTVVARCPGEHPLVIRDDPVDAAGHPFPTLFWLTCPTAVKAVSHLEADGWIRRLNHRAQTDPSFADALAATHQEYARERSRGLSQALTWGGVGGAKRGVKCLHAHYANHLAGGADPVGAWVAGEVEPIHPEERGGRAGAVDLGTNSIRLLVASAKPAAGGLEEFSRDMVITRIGQGVDATGRIDPEALARTVDVLARYCHRALALHAGRIRVAATAAVRDASSREELEAAVRDHADTALEVITGEKEAGLSFLGATRGLDALPPYLVLDIGGGSTEFVVGADHPEAAVSTPMGSVRLTERFVRTDPPSRGDLAALAKAVKEILDDVQRAVPITTARTFVAVAGTATTVQAISLRLPFYDPEAIHRTWLSLSEAERVLGELARMTNPERSAIPVMAPGRGDVIVAGATILVEVMRRFGFDRTLVSETDLLDGLVLELLESL